MAIKQISHIESSMVPCHSIGNNLGNKKLLKKDCDIITTIELLGYWLFTSFYGIYYLKAWIYEAWQVLCMGKQLDKM